MIALILHTYQHSSLRTPQVPLVFNTVQMTLLILKGKTVALDPVFISSPLRSSLSFLGPHALAKLAPQSSLVKSARGSSILKDGGGNILALAAHNWIAVIIHWESDAFQGLKID